MCPFQQMPGPENDMSDEDYDSLIRVYKRAGSNMRYFMMNSKYGWVEVSRYEYDNPPESMINNKAWVNYDGLATVTVANIALCSLADLTRLLTDIFKK